MGLLKDLIERIKISFCCRSKCSINDNDFTPREVIEEWVATVELEAPKPTPKYDYYSGKQKKYLSNI